MFSEPPFPSTASVPQNSAGSSGVHCRTSTRPSNKLQRTSVPSSVEINLKSTHCQQEQAAVTTRQMKIGKYFLERTIGKGNFAVVKLATHCETNQKVAIKIIDKSRLDPSDHKKLEREIAVMKSLNHPFIIRLYEVMESKNLIYLVTEYAANGELLDLLLREKRLSEGKAREKFRQLIHAVEYIHSKHIVHRDLKAENLLLDSRGNIKVADFGFANIFKPNSKLQTFCGSPPYAAPELYQCLPYSPEKVDVWSLGVLLYVFVCGNLPFDSNNLTDLRKRVLAGQFRLPFYISLDCGSLIQNMLAVDPDQRYTIQDIKNHRWLMSQDSIVHEVTSTTNPTIENSHLRNAILAHAESLGYNRNQIVKSVERNSYDSDAAIWHLLLEKFQQTCHIDNSHIPNDSNVEPESSNKREADEKSSIFDGRNCQIDFARPNSKEENENDFRSMIRPPVESSLNVGEHDENDEQEENSEIESDDQDEVTSAQLLEQYTRNHGLRRHTIARPDIFLPADQSSNLLSNVHFGHPLLNIEPKLLTNRFQPTIVSPTENDEHFQSETVTNFFIPSADSSIPVDLKTFSRQRDQNQYLSPPISNNFHLNRRASDSGAHLSLFQQEFGANNFSRTRPTHLQSPLSNRSSRGSITRGAPITTPTFSITPHEAEEDQNSEEEEKATLARYLKQGKRHTVCEQGLFLAGKTRRAPPNRDSPKERTLMSRRASDTTTNFINPSARAHLERLYNNAVNSKTNDEDDLTASSLQELHKLQKQVHNYPTTNLMDPSILRRSAAPPSPTNSTGLHRIQEENQRNSDFFSTSPYSNEEKSFQPFIESSTNGGDGSHEMDCDVHINPHLQYLPPDEPFRPPYYQEAASLFYCNNSSLLAQHLQFPTTTTSSFIP